MSGSQALAPVLRTGYLLVPNDDILDRVTGAIRALSYAPGTIGSLIVSQWIDDGTADQIVGEMQEALSVRSAAAQAILGGALAPVHDNRCPHLWRSEEHTSELQSLMRNSYAVLCLKKKNNNKRKPY